MHKIVRSVVRSRTQSSIKNHFRFSQFRNASAWLTRASDDSSLSKDVDVEKLFTNPEVRSLLNKLTGMDLENKVFRPRRTSIQQRSHYALMTEERLEQTMERMVEEARLFLQFVPIKEPRANTVEILSRDTDIAGFDSSKFVFTDITFDATDQDRVVVVREVDGTLRTATPEEHDRMNRVYYEKPNRPIKEPAVFTDPWLQNALDRNEHEFVLDWACWYFEPDDPAFVKLSQTIFDRIVSSGKLDVLHSTRHFGTFAFYLALNGNIPPLLNFFGGMGRISECANLVRLHKTLHPDWRVAVGSTDSEHKIVEDFLKQNARLRGVLFDLIAFVKHGTIKKIANKQAESREDLNVKKQDNDLSSKASVNASNIHSSTGPLGVLSEVYGVRVEKGDAALPKRVNQRQNSRGRFQGRGRNRSEKAARNENEPKEE